MPSAAQVEREGLLGAVLPRADDDEQAGGILFETPRRGSSRRTRRVAQRALIGRPRQAAYSACHSALSVRAAATVIFAMGDGKRSAFAIDSWLNGVWPPVGADKETRAKEPAAAS